MAKNYRTSHAATAVDLGVLGGPTLFAKIKPIESEQSLGSYLANVKCSVLNNVMFAGPSQPNFTVHASTDGTGTMGNAYVVTTGATPAGGGTVTLSLKRRIRESDEDVSRSDSPIFLWVQCTQNDVSPTDSQNCTVYTEAWGRFIEVVDP